MTKRGPQRECLQQLRGGAPLIAPSMLLCDFGNLEREITALEAAGVQLLHLDVMDGNFVPNFTYGITIVEAVRKLTDLPLDVHLMIAQPERYVDSFIDAGADLLTIHIEAAPRPTPILERIRELGCAAGLTLNPKTPVREIAEFLDLCDLVLVMSVQPGFGGQSFDPIALEKLRELRQATSEDFLLSIDGGVNKNTVGSCVEAGANLLVIGSAIFRANHYGDAIRELEQLAAAGG